MKASEKSGPKISAKALKALKGSIRKWQKIVAGKERDRGYRNCPLCEQFFWDGCQGCPVAKDAHMPNCLNTPHEPWVRHHDVMHTDKPDARVYCDDCRLLAEDELDYLKSLLPKGRSK